MAGLVIAGTVRSGSAFHAGNETTAGTGARVRRNSACGSFRFDRAVEHDLLAAAEHAEAERKRSQEGHYGKRDLNAEQAFTTPVDIVELEKKRGLVERKAHSYAEGKGEPRLEILVAAQDRGRTGGEGDHDAGHEVMNVAPADPDVTEGTEG